VRASCSFSERSGKRLLQQRIIEEEASRPPLQLRAGRARAGSAGGPAGTVCAAPELLGSARESAVCAPNREASSVRSSPVAARICAAAEIARRARSPFFFNDTATTE